MSTDSAAKTRTARQKPGGALIGSILFISVLLTGVFGIVIPPPDPPKMPRETAAAPALAPHVLFVIVDGLRWDIAQNPTIMPNFSAALAKETGGELMAGRVSMTTSAVLAFGTGQRGRFEQIVRNVKPALTPYDSWLARAKQAGRRVMAVGDPAWVDMYGVFIDEHRLDPEGVAIDVDFNPRTFRSARELLVKNPDAFVVHFVTPDHQAHAYTVPSARYAEHMRGFDRDLFQFLSEVPRDYAVIVAGDHGASDSGTHGADVAIQRRTAVFAYGQGIAPGVHAREPLDQVDLADTISALLGLPFPAHSRGHVLAEWLDAPLELRAKLACADARRSLEYASASRFSSVVSAIEPSVRQCTTLAPEASLSAAKRVALEVDKAVESEGGFSSPWVPPLVFLLAVIGIGTISITLGRKAMLPIAIGAFVAAAGVALTWGVERLPGNAPNLTRIVLFAICNLPALALLVAPGRAAHFGVRKPGLAAALVPGILLATYTTNAQPEAFAAILLGLVLFALLGGLDPRRPHLGKSSSALGPADLAFLAFLAAILVFPGTRPSELYPDWLRNSPKLTLAAALALIAATTGVMAWRSDSKRRLAWGAGFALIAGAALVLRRIAPPLAGRSAIVLSLAATLFFALRRRRLAALLCGITSYAWISRDAEFLALSASVLIADAAGAALARHRERHAETDSALTLPNLLLVTTFLFGLVFVQRIGIQGAIDFGAMDWGVAGFGDPHVPVWIVSGALAAKYALAALLVVVAFATRLGPVVSLEILRAMFVAFMARGVVLSAMFLLSGASFWTGLRVMGDLPFALLWTLAIALFWFGERYATSPWSSSN